jgi:serine/threonine protein phosphatase PrpC
MNPRWRSGVATDPGLVRSSNEDRYWVDDENGIFLVVDGVGGHAAGERAAEMAVDVIRQHLLTLRNGTEERVRAAITRANNEMYGHAQGSEECAGMACVLTLAVVEDDQITIGHVGDSRLYLIWNGWIRKLTADHSPVGIDEDAGEISEEQAMLHPRRNEVFRDVGSRPRCPRDEDFIDVRRCRFRPDAAFLLCSDGLSDLLTSSAMRDIIQRYDGDPERVARELVEAANQAGGKDNITALFVAGAEFRGQCAEDPARHVATRPRLARQHSHRLIYRRLTGRLACLIYGAALGFAMWAGIQMVKW